MTGRRRTHLSAAVTVRDRDVIICDVRNSQPAWTFKPRARSALVSDHNNTRNEHPIYLLFLVRFVQLQLKAQQAVSSTSFPSLRCAHRFTRPANGPGSSC